MYSPTEVVEVFAWGKRVGAVSLDPFSGLYVFQYNQNWLRISVNNRLLPRFCVVFLYALLRNAILAPAPITPVVGPVVSTYGNCGT